MTQVILLVLVSAVLWGVVAYAYWYSIKKTYGMREERAKATHNPTKSNDDR